MYQVMLIDDEPIIRQGMRYVIDWESQGFKIIGDYGQATEGLEAIVTKQPDLVFVDIKMPRLSGIDLVKQAQQAGFEGAFVILSGYSNFDYAKASIKLGVHAYLLKPIDEDELIGCLRDVKQSIEEKATITDQLTAYVAQTEHEAWRAVIDGRKHDWMRSSHLENTNGPFYVAGIFIKKEVSRSFMKQVFNDHQLSQARVIFKEQRIYLIYQQPVKASVKDELKQTLIMIKKLIDPDAFSCLTDQIDTLEGIREAIETIERLADLAYSLPYQTIYTTAITETSSESVSSLNVTELATKVIQALEFKDSSIMSTFKQALTRYFQSHLMIKDRVQAEVLELSLRITDMIHKQYPDVELPAKEDWFGQIYSSESLFDLVDVVSGEFWKSRSQISGFSLTKEKDMEKVVGYIEQYYAEDLSLKLLADLFNYNSSYLGKKFKKHTGVYFHVFLERTRIEKAKALLENPTLKIYQVSEQVGYNNMDYFYKKFKKHVGKSPKEYQKSITSEGLS